MTALPPSLSAKPRRVGAPMDFRVERGTATSRIFGIFALLVLIALAALPYYGSLYAVRLMAEMSVYLALAQLWNLLGGYAGLVSAGQQAYVGLGGYALLVLTGPLGLHPLPALVLAGVVAAVLSLPIALAVFRLRGAYFAIGTWVVAEVCQLVIAQIPALGSGSGASLSPAIVRAIAPDRATRETIVYWISLAVAVAVFALVYRLLRSRHGLALTAIRDSEPASRSLGVDTFRTKLLIYVVAAFGTGMVGALVLLQKLRISPESGFSVQDWTVIVIFMVVIGGIGTLEGPIVGLLLYFGLRQLLADYGSIYLMLLGLVAAGVMLGEQEGIWGLIARRFHLQLFPVRRHFRRSGQEERG